MPCRHESGDLDAAARAAAFVAEGEYSTPLIQQACMGTAGCIAEFDTQDNLTIWAKTQIPFLAQRDFNRALNDMGLAGQERARDRALRSAAPSAPGSTPTHTSTSRSCWRTAPASR